MLLDRTSPDYLPQHRVTDLTIGVVSKELDLAWTALGEKAQPPSALLLALWGLATRWGTTELYNFNYSQLTLDANVWFKWTSVVSCQWLTKEQIRSFRSKEGGDLVSQDNGPGTVKLTTNGLKYQTWFEPPHAMTKRPAFDSSVDGCIDFVYMLRRMYGSTAKLWDTIEREDPIGLCNLIKHYRLTPDSLSNLQNRLIGAIRKARIEISNFKRSNGSVEPIVYTQALCNVYTIKMTALRNGDRK